MIWSPRITRAAVATLAGLLFATAALSGSATAETPSRSVEIRPSKAALRSAAQLRDQALKSDEALQLLTALTTEVGPRFAGTPGDLAGVEWTRRKLVDLGFTEVRTPEVIVPRWVRGEASAEVLAPYPQSMVTVAIGGSIGTADEGLVAPVVMVKDLAALQALPAGAVKGKIVFFAGRTERTRDGSGYGKAVRSRTEGPSAAAASGAVGIVVRSIGTSTNRIAHTGTLSYNIAVSNPDADMLERQFASGREVSLRMRVTARDLPQVRSANVIGDLRGTDLAEEIVLVGGHLDTWDLGMGVQDDGAGVAIAIAAARLAAQMTPRPRRTIRVVAFANEEFGLSGAARYPADEGDESVGKHAFAMEADLGDGPVWKIGGRVPPAHWPLIEGIHGVAKGLGVELGDNTS
ncbi:MAG: M20/M25/M40 family metallo-hydrolase, partial [Proteobacteria bacterium]|nr:M20/M25/M40 family metallo-hydrolase [Pseudomonadota bacterium]